MKNWKVLIVILLIVIAVAIIVGFGLLNSNFNKSDLLNRYNLTETEYNNLKLLANTAIKNINEEKIESTEVYYSKTGNMLVARGIKNAKGPIGVGNYTYIVVSGDNVKVLQGTDAVLFGTETVNSWYGGGFTNAIKDKEYKDYIYFESLEDLQDII